MGVDIQHNKDQKVGCKEPKRQDIYLRLWVKLYRFLARRTNSTFNQVVLKSLLMSRSNRPPMSLSRMIRKMKPPGLENKAAVVVGTITDDMQVQEVPKLKVCTLRVSNQAAAASSRQEARSSPSTSWPWTPPRTTAPSCSLLLTRAARCIGIWARPRESPHSHNKSYSAPRARKGSLPQANRTLYLLYVPTDIDSKTLPAFFTGCLAGGYSLNINLQSLLSTAPVLAFSSSHKESKGLVLPVTLGTAPALRLSPHPAYPSLQSRFQHDPDS
ncbi:ribosomal protein L18-like [Carlito syrichta]|uniref:Ribosomal protein L18-like n=1 Tax=Carlito syrichta TaxID=1868482 RepID=A0A3Q0DSV0_CARSF|nr:ribosomal protein L18-like [Carlito syrichta]